MGDWADRIRRGLPGQGQTLRITTTGANTLNLGINKVAVSSVKVAVGTINIIDSALQNVTSQRSVHGAVQNRLEFIITTLAIQEENSAAAENLNGVVKHVSPEEMLKLAATSRTIRGLLFDRST